MAICPTCEASHASTKRHYCKSCFDQLSTAEQQSHTQQVSKEQQNQRQSVHQQHLHQTLTQTSTNTSLTNTSASFGFANMSASNAGLSNPSNCATNINAGAGPQSTTLGDEYWSRLDALLNSKVKVIEDKFDAAVSVLDTRVKTLESKCVQYEEDLSHLKSIVVKQQRCLNNIDSAERSCNIIVAGLTEETIFTDNGTYDDDHKKIEALLRTIDLPLPRGYKIDRLGKKAPNAKFHRYIKFNVGDKENRDNILKQANRLKDIGDPWSNIYLKKDLHPVIVDENKRLRKKKYELSKLEENKNKEIKIDKGKLKIDDTVVDHNLFFA